MRGVGGGSPVENSVIQVTRGNESFGRYRQLRVFIDNADVGTVPWNATTEFQAAPGEHTVFVKMDWCRSVPFRITLNEGNILRLSVTIPVGSFRMFYCVLFAASSFFCFGATVDVAGKDRSLEQCRQKDDSRRTMCCSRPATRGMGQPRHDGHSRVSRLLSVAFGRHGGRLGWGHVHTKWSDSS